ncbi:toxin YdaT family protein [Escherichia coli]|nr:toxin YdaT family protein [Escherichia coli]
MKIKHEHIRMAMNAWAHPDGEKVPAAKITKAYFELGMTFPELYDDSHPEVLARNTQKIFRWVEKDTPDAVEKIQALLPAIEKAMPPLLVARMRSHSSAYFRELVETREQCHLCWWPECAATVQPIFGSWWRRERLVRDADDFVAVAIAGFNQMNRGGPAGNAVAVH